MHRQRCTGALQRKLKHREALTRIIQHAKDFKDHHKNAAARAARLGDMVARWHRATMTEEKRARERAEQNRRRALKYLLGRAKRAFCCTQR